VNPGIAVTLGNVNAALHVLGGAVNVGAAGKITTFTLLLEAHKPVPAVPAATLPHAVDKT
jgi:hypothetical protein